jgi:hypothetical protein
MFGAKNLVTNHPMPWNELPKVSISKFKKKIMMEVLFTRNSLT